MEIQSSWDFVVKQLTCMCAMIYLIAHLTLFIVLFVPFFILTYIYIYILLCYVSLFYCLCYFYFLFYYYYYFFALSIERTCPDLHFTTDYTLYDCVCDK